MIQLIRSYTKGAVFRVAVAVITLTKGNLGKKGSIYSHFHSTAHHQKQLGEEPGGQGLVLLRACSACFFFYSAQDQ